MAFIISESTHKQSRKKTDMWLMCHCHKADITSLFWYVQLLQLGFHKLRLEWHFIVETHRCVYVHPHPKIFFSVDSTFIVGALHSKLEDLQMSAWSLVFILTKWSHLNTSRSFLTHRCVIYIYNTCISGIRIWSDGWLALVVTWNWLMLPISIHAYYSNKLCLYLNCLWLGCALTTNMKVAVFTYFSASSVILRVFKGGKIRWLQMTAFEIIKQRRNWDLKN